jgi:hypothetical protein
MGCQPPSCEFISEDKATAPLAATQIANLEQFDFELRGMRERTHSEGHIPGIEHNEQLLFDKLELSIASIYVH